MRASIWLGVALLIAPGCSKPPQPKPIPLSEFYRTDYRTWDCQQLAEEADLLADSLALAKEQEEGSAAEA